MGQRIDRQLITNAVYIVIFSYLILSIFNSLYLEKGPALKPHQPDHYDVENVAVKACRLFVLYQRLL